MFYSIKIRDLVKNDQILILVDKETEKMHRFMPTLEIIAQVSPLIGLLGTVIGMIDSFNELELGGSLVDPSILLEEFETDITNNCNGINSSNSINKSLLL